MRAKGSSVLGMASIALASVVLLAAIYVAQIVIARGYNGALVTAQTFLRAAIEWLAWLMLVPPILRLTRRFPVGPNRPRRNLAVLLAGAVVATMAWAALVAGPVSALRLPQWAWQGPADFRATWQNALVPRGAYLIVVYGLVVGLATARRLADERQTAALRIAEVDRELAAADLASFAETMGSNQLAERLERIASAMDRSIEAAEAETLELAQDLHTALLRSRELLKN